MATLHTKIKNKIDRDRAYDALVDFAPDGWEGSDLDTLMDLAIDYALDETDAEQESDGSWNDLTPYENCMDLAVAERTELMQCAHDERGDYLRGLQQDR